MVATVMIECAMQHLLLKWLRDESLESDDTDLPVYCHIHSAVACAVLRIGAMVKPMLFHDFLHRRVSTQKVLWLARSIPLDYLEPCDRGV
jgi:hypothetical protein